MCPIEAKNICIYSLKPEKIEGKNFSDEQLTPFFTETDYHYFVKSSN